MSPRRARMRVAVLGGGLQGCCVALALAERGVEVTLFERDAVLLGRAATANEGKIHLGFTYGADPGLETARMMIRGALAFSPYLERHLGLAPDRLHISSPCTYLVHRDSQKSPQETRSYLDAVHDLIREATQAPGAGSYFGRGIDAPPREWSAADLAAEFDSSLAAAAFTTPEVAIDPESVAQPLGAACAAHPRVELRLENTVRAVQETARGLQVVTGADTGHDEKFDQVVNALWDGRMVVDATLGIKPSRPWVHRFKYGITFKLPAGMDALPTVTVVLGPYGDVVNYRNGVAYCSWYPACMREISHTLEPPAWPVSPDDRLRAEITDATLAGLSRIVPALGGAVSIDPAQSRVRGGVITAWGSSDIDDRRSVLHTRWDIGISSRGRYHSIDPGKLTMVPYFAEMCAGRVLGG